MIVRVADDGDLRMADIDFQNAELAEQQVAGRNAQRPVLESADRCAALADNADAVELDAQYGSEAMPFDAIVIGSGFGGVDIAISCKSV